VQCLTSPPTQYRLYGRRFLQVKRPNQQYQSTEGSYKGKQLTRGWLPQRAGSPSRNGGGAAAAVHPSNFTAD